VPVTSFDHLVTWPYRSDPLNGEVCSAATQSHSGLVLLCFATLSSEDRQRTDGVQSRHM